MPVCRVARQSGHFQAQHNAGLAHADVRNQFLETFAIGSRSPRLSEIIIDNDNLLDSPTQGDRALLKGILPFCAFGVLQNLSNRRLPDIKVSIPLQMTSVHFLVGIGSHQIVSCCCVKIIAARMFVMAKRISREKSWTIVEGALAVSFEGKHVDQARIQPVMPRRRNKVRPGVGPRPVGKSTASLRSCS